jgi:hypothetical protein
MTSSGIEAATFWLVAYSVNQLRYRVPRIRRRWEDYVKMQIRKIGWGRVDWFNVSKQGPVAALVNTVMDVRVP